MTDIGKQEGTLAESSVVGEPERVEERARRSLALLALLKKCLACINPATYPHAAGMVVLMIIGALLEALGVGLVLPLVKVVSDPQILSQNEWTHAFFGEITPENHASVLILVAGIFLGAIVFKNAFLLLIYFVQGSFFARNDALLARKLFSHYMAGDYGLHLLRNSAGLINNVTSTASVVFSHALRSFMTIGIEVFLIIIVVIILLLADFWMTVGAFATTSIAMAVFYYAIRQRMTAWGRQSTEARQNIIKILQQGLHSIKEVKVLGREDFVLQNFNVQREIFAHAETRMFVANNAPRLWVETVVIACAMLGIMAIALQDNDTSDLFSVLALFAAAAVRLIPSMNRILMAMNAIRGGAYPVNVIYEDLQTFKGAPLAPTSAVPSDFKFRTSIVLKDVSFAYPNTRQHAVSNIDLCIENGQSVGFVGPSGSGKTTLVDIILGLLPPASGKIQIDGADISEILPAWRSVLSYVPQNVYLLDDSLRRNIAFALHDEDISEERLRNAIRMAQLEDFVAALPKGLDTDVGEQGARLSGGQRQRVGLARALYRDPSVLVLDEATSALDSETENQINKVINSLHGKKTIITIAHRLSTVRSCDVLVFLDQGRIADVGTFEELTQRNPAFCNLVKLAEL